MDLTAASYDQLFPLIFVLVVWELIWKGFALWKAAKNNSKNWFIVLLVINSAGILPVIYLLFFSKKKASK